MVMVMVCGVGAGLDGDGVAADSKALTLRQERIVID